MTIHFDAAPLSNLLCNPAVHKTRPCNIKRADTRPIVPDDASRKPGVSPAGRLMNTVRNLWSPRPSQPVYEVNERLLEEVVRANEAPAKKGAPVAGIPGTKVDVDKRSIAVIDLRTGRMVSSGDCEFRYSQQSMSKPTAMILAGELIGRDALEKNIGFEASGKKYNEPAYLPGKVGVPSNSSVNMGALKVWDIITAHCPPDVDPVDLYLEFLRKLTGNPNLSVNEEMARGEYEWRPAGGNGLPKNQELIQQLKKDGALKSEDSDKVFLNYCRACAIMVTTTEMARVSAVIANQGRDPSTGEQLIHPALADLALRSNAITGSYDESGTEFKKAGFMGKTGVDGGIFGVLTTHPDLAFAFHHQELNGAGNSGESQKWIHALGKMKLAFPIEGKRAKAKHLLTMRPGAVSIEAGKLGPSPREIDHSLRASLTERSRSDLEAALAASNSNKPDGYYMKPLKGSALRQAAILDRSKTSLTLQTHDERTLYATIQPSTHNLAKVVVSATAPEEIQRAANAEARERGVAAVRSIAPRLVAS